MREPDTMVEHPYCKEHDCETHECEEQHRGTARPVSDPDEKVLQLVQRHSVTLADLYRRGRAKGLISARSAYQ